jgi:hypothetical protein
MKKYYNYYIQSEEKVKFFECFSHYLNLEEKEEKSSLVREDF